MKIEVDIQKKYAFAILGVLILIAGFVAVNAFGTSTPSTFGHSASEIDWSSIVPNIKATQLNTSQICLSGNCQTTWPAGGGSGNFTDTNAATICSGAQVLLGNGSCMNVNQALNPSSKTYDLNVDIAKGGNFLLSVGPNIVKNFSITWTDNGGNARATVQFEGNNLGSFINVGSPETRTFVNPQLVSSPGTINVTEVGGFDNMQIISIKVNYL